MTNFDKRVPNNLKMANFLAKSYIFYGLAVPKAQQTFFALVVHFEIMINLCVTFEKIYFKFQIISISIKKHCRMILDSIYLEMFAFKYDFAAPKHLR